VSFGNGIGNRFFNKKVNVIQQAFPGDRVMINGWHRDAACINFSEQITHIINWLRIVLLRNLLRGFLIGIYNADQLAAVILGIDTRVVLTKVANSHYSYADLIH
jgi:hypothetical protein